MGLSRRMFTKEFKLAAVHRDTVAMPCVAHNLVVRDTVVIGLRLCGGRTRLADW